MLVPTGLQKKKDEKEKRRKGLGSNADITLSVFTYATYSTHNAAWWLFMHKIEPFPQELKIKPPSPTQQGFN